jgi:nucleoid-associated protein YgaU
VYFQWGSRTLFDAFLRSVSARYTLFKSDGAPLRANVTVVFEEVPSEPARQNPTSGGRTGERARLVKPGDSLQSIAYQEYGDPTRWRRLAAANDIDDPLRLEAGTQLRIPAGRTDGGRS